MPRSTRLPEGLREGVFSVGSAVEQGVGRGRLRGSDLERPFRGVRAHPGAADDLLGRCRAYATRLRPGDYFSHTTAARLWGVPLPARYEHESRLHVSTALPNRAPTGAGIRGHQVEVLKGAVVLRHGLPVSDAATTWCDIAGVLTRSSRSTGVISGLDDLVAAGDHLVLTPERDDPDDPRPYTRIPELAARVAGGFHRRGIRSARLAVPQIRDGAESRPETLVRLALIARGLTEPELQVRLFDDGGAFIGRADMYYPSFRVVVEYDGEQHRTDDTQYAKDARRVEEFQLARNAVVRIRKQALPNLWLECARVERTLRARGWTPSH